jgi:pyruvate dehydrogenase E1 component
VARCLSVRCCHPRRRARALCAGPAGAPGHTAQVGWQPELATPYVNTIAVDQQQPFPGDLAIEEKLASLMRWNALAMVVRANQAYGELGGHIASYASAADLFEVGFNHFFRARKTAARRRPGVLPAAQRAWRLCACLSGRAPDRSRPGALPPGDHRAHRKGARGLSSYPHPWLMPDFWQFPTGSMGIGPISSIYHARFMRYLTHRNLLDCNGHRKVWGVFGDGEMDEPESMSALTLAARESWTTWSGWSTATCSAWTARCAATAASSTSWKSCFRGAGWNVIKLVWGSDWDGLFARDLTGALVQAFANTVDGQMQTFAAKDGRFNRDNFFGQNEELARWPRA